MFATQRRTGLQPILAIALFLSAGASAPAAAQRSLIGVHQSWGAFRGSGRCYAIAEPQARRGRDTARPHAAVSFLPARGIRGQVHIRLGREKRAGSAVLLRIDGRSFQLIAGPFDAWAADARADGEIVAAMRTGLVMVVETRATGGTLLRDRYPLRGAATAIDAAAVACARAAAGARRR